MGKFYRYAMIMVGLLVLFYFAGMVPESTTLNLIISLLNLENFQNLDIMTKTLTAIVGVGVAGTIALVFLARSIELPIMAIVVPFFVAILFDFTAVVTRLTQENAFISVIIMGPLLFGFSLTALDWWRGRD